MAFKSREGTNRKRREVIDLALSFVSKSIDYRCGRGRNICPNPDEACTGCEYLVQIKAGFTVDYQETEPQKEVIGGN